MRISFPEIETHYLAKEPPLPINQVFAGIAVVDYGSALAWYTRFLRRPPDVEARDDRPACIGLL
jgi:hypothetical protein